MKAREKGDGAKSPPLCGNKTACWRLEWRVERTRTLFWCRVSSCFSCGLWFAVCGCSCSSCLLPLPPLVSPASLRWRREVR